MGQGGQIPDQSAQFYLFDRVVNVRHGYSVPFGLRGTVVGLHKADQEADTMYDVVFDEVFQGGITLRLVGSSSGQAFWLRARGSGSECRCLGISKSRL